MQLQKDHFYHLYNRTNNAELLFKEDENYIYLLRKFKNRLSNFLSVKAYCLMPTHFHFLVQVGTEDSNNLMKEIGIQLSSYTKAINKKYNRNGSLFQRHTKLKLIDDNNYLWTLISYIHQNPVRSNLVSKLEDWPYSSYRDLAGYRNGSLPDKKNVLRQFQSKENFVRFSEQTVKNVKSDYWI